MSKTVKSKNIVGITDLVVWAPIREGFIDAFDNITYETRLHLVAEALHQVRKSAREFETIAPFSDTAERILTLLDFRIGVVDRELFDTQSKSGGGSTLKPKRHMYLVATFDGPWEPYMRLIWKPLGAFLDLLLCNCEDYVTAVDNSFEKYAAWVREHQLDSAIFYSTTGLTVKDQSYLGKLERYQREMEPLKADAAIARMTSDDPRIRALEERKGPVAFMQMYRLALEALTVLYRLADYYPPDRLKPTQEHPDAEGRYLLRVAHSLLHDWKFGDIPKEYKGGFEKELAILREAFATQLEWFELGPQYPEPAEEQAKILDPSEIQKGLLTAYDSKDQPITHGALLLLQIDNVEDFRNFIGTAFPFSWEAEAKQGAGLVPDRIFAGVYANIAFTYTGLERLELGGEILRTFPPEFGQGMEERAPLLGDMGANHPRNWALPARYRPSLPRTITDQLPPVEMSEVDVVIQLRTAKIGATGMVDRFVPFSDEAAEEYQRLLRDNQVPQGFLGAATSSFSGGGSDGTTDANNPIKELVMSFTHWRKQTGMTLLAVENMFRPDVAKPPAGEGPDNYSNVDHFGFRDGLSQPVPVEKPAFRDEVPYGDLFRGHRNSLEDTAADLNPYLMNSSFLAVRKLSQDVEEFKTFLGKYEQKEDTLGTSSEKQFTPGELAAWLVGRDRGGKPLIQPAQGNDFDYKQDKAGEQCPFSAHIRRTNPRNEFHGRPAPRILRRGMTYGVPFEECPKSERGIIFMAYNASLAEQFEVIQRWVNGANSNDTVAAQNDPLVGDVPEGKPRTFRFVKDGEVCRVVIEKPFVKLEWGTYLFVPSRTALTELAKDPGDVVNVRNERIDAGHKKIAHLLEMAPETQRNEWKVVLEDFMTKDPDERATSTDVWRAIISDGGALRIESGINSTAAPNTTEPLLEDVQPVVLIANEDLIMQVLADHEKFSVSVQGARTQMSTGSIYVAQDPGQTYWDESTATNHILFSIREEDAFNVGYQASLKVMETLKAVATKLGRKSMKVELRSQYLRPALADVCNYWFGLPDGKHIQFGSWEWGNDPGTKATCPGDFMAPSRHAFYPRPTPAITEYGIRHGKRLKAAAKDFVKELNPDQISGKITAAMRANISDDDVRARNLIGIMIGALPPIDGNLRGVLFDWLRKESLWRHQDALHRAANGAAVDYAAAKAALWSPIVEAMMKRPAPDLIFRTAKEDCSLNTAKGVIEIRKGDTLILSLVAATQHRLDGYGKPSVDVVFGGRREAPNQTQGKPVHACPAYAMAMGTMMGIMAALLDAGRLKALPASLILEITGWEPAPSIECEPAEPPSPAT